MFCLMEVGCGIRDVRYGISQLCSVFTLNDTFYIKAGGWFSLFRANSEEFSVFDFRIYGQSKVNVSPLPGLFQSRPLCVRDLVLEAQQYFSA